MQVVVRVDQPRPQLPGTQVHDVVERAAGLDELTSLDGHWAAALRPQEEPQPVKRNASTRGRPRCCS